MNPIEKKAIDYIVEIPQLLGLAVVSLLNGHLWNFIIITYVKKGRKGNSWLNTKLGKTAIGVSWNALVFIPFQLSINHTIIVEWNHIINLMLVTLLASMVFELIIFGIVIKLCKEI